MSVYVREEGAYVLIADRTLVDGMPSPFESFSDDIPLVRRCVDDEELLLVDEMLQSRTRPRAP